MQNPEKPDEDVIWLDHYFGVRIELLNASLIDGRPSARAARLVIVSRAEPADSLVVPSEFTAVAALELAQFLMFAASAIDPSVVMATVGRAAAENRFRRVLEQLPTETTH